MAITTEENHKKRYGRLESFLQRNIPDEFARVNWYEPCITSSEVEKPTFKFVVVTDERLIVTENPPHQLQISVPLKDIITLELLNDFPEFLSGEEREKTQHIRILYKKKESPNSHRPGSLTPSTIDPRCVSRTTIATTITIGTPEIANRRWSQSSRISSSSSDLTSGTSGSKELVKQKKNSQTKWKRIISLLVFNKKKRENISGWKKLEDSRMCLAMRPLSSAEALNAKNLSTSFQKPVDSWSSEKDKQRTKTSLTFRLFRRQKVKKLTTTFDDTFLSHDESSEVPIPTYVHGHRRLPSPKVQIAPSITGKTEKFLGPSLEKKEPQTMRCDSAPISTAVVSNDDLVAGLLQLPSSRRPYKNYPRSYTAIGNYGDYQLVSRQETNYMNCAEGIIGSSYSNSSACELQKQELHLYVLSSQSAIFRHLTTAWHSYLVRETLAQEKTVARPCKNGISTNFSHVFVELHRRLQLSKEEEYVDLRRLVESLEKEFHSAIVKRIFWKDPLLFPLVVDRLHMLVSAPENVENQTVGVTMDKLKLCSSLASALSSLLNNTGPIPGRSYHLTKNNGYILQKLTEVLTRIPWIPLPYRDNTFAVVTSHSRLYSQEWETLREAPLIRSVVELTNACTGTMYQLILLIQQGKELIYRQCSFSLSWMVQLVASSEASIAYMYRLMSQIIMTVFPEYQTPITPIQCVLLYKHFYVLMTLITHSKRLAQHMRLTYSEEFRYYIFSQELAKKIPENCPIRNVLLQLTDSVKNYIQRKSPHIQNSADVVYLDSRLKNI
ncbi:uncharacterized protein C12orf56-like [Tachypleus tridentatus]|uniref:uncharacterized protein C12orf56-like n=1 Tax=Tachypleus tridentatus TaxID=6853 RepID=UPI003FD69FCB